MIDPRLKRDIKAAEGCKLTAYRDTRGFWTIGWGHLLDGQDMDHTGHTCTQAEADAWLEADIARAQAQAVHTIEWPMLNICRENAITELIFNMGLHKWLGFEKCRRALGLGDWAEAKVQLLDSAWAMQVQPQGLDKPGRATRIAGYILDGAYP